MRRILVIRTDNIGDLVCTTPLLAALRARHPEAWIGVLANAYSATVLEGNPDVNAVFAYRKAKHRDAGDSALKVHLERLRLILHLRRLKIDDAVLAAPGGGNSARRFARWIGARNIVGDDIAVTGTHEVERVFSRLAAFGIAGEPPTCRIVAPAGTRQLAPTLPAAFAGRPLVGLHISARKPSQRWPAERFAALAQTLHARCGAAFLLFWSPGDEDNAVHPGDDRKAAAVVAATADLPLVPMPTHTLTELAAGLSLCDSVICSDGGAMHIAAGLGKPIVCLFGQSDAARWHPWGVPYRLLQPDSRDVADVSVGDVELAHRELLEKHAS
jgi:ADP-heptose:LPS heptosyltransferase